MSIKPNKPVQAKKWNHIFQRGDILIQYWTDTRHPHSKRHKIRQYIVYDKEKIYSQLNQEDYIVYKAYVMYFKAIGTPSYRVPPADGLRIGDTHSITQYSDSSLIGTNASQGYEVVPSGLSWEDLD